MTLFNDEQNYKFNEIDNEHKEHQFALLPVAKFVCIMLTSKIQYL